MGRGFSRQRWFLLVAVILAIPVLTVIAFTKARAAERELDENRRHLRDITAQLGTLSEAVRVLQTNAAVAPAPRLLVPLAGGKVSAT